MPRTPRQKKIGFVARLAVKEKPPTSLIQNSGSTLIVPRLTARPIRQIRNNSTSSAIAIPTNQAVEGIYSAACGRSCTEFGP